MTARRWLVLVLAPLAGAAIVIVLTLAANAIALTPSGASSATRTTAVGVGLREYRIALYRSRVLPGRVKFNMENLGEDAHDLRVVGPGSSGVVRGTSAAVRAGERGVFVVTLKRRGLYRVVCTLGDHEAQGMVSRLRVVQRL